MRLALLSTFVGVFSIAFSSTSISRDALQYVLPVIYTCAPNGVNICDNDEQRCLKNTTASQQVFCCANWKSCMICWGCDVSAYTCQ